MISDTYCVGAPVDSSMDESDFEFAAGDTVRVDLDIETVKLMQEGHGGWVDAMTEVRNIKCNTGLVHECLSTRLIQYMYTSLCLVRLVYYGFIITCILVYS